MLRCAETGLEWPDAVLLALYVCSTANGKHQLSLHQIPMKWPMLYVFLTHHQKHCINVNFYLKKKSCLIFLPTVLNFRLCYHSLVSYHHPRKYQILLCKVCCKLFSAVEDAGCSVKEKEQGAIGDHWQGRDLTSQDSAYSDQAK